jgi:integrase
MPKQVNRIPGIKQLPSGMWQARLFHDGGEESRNFERQEDAERWKRNLKSELDRCTDGVERKKRMWVATFIDESGIYTKSFDDVDSANKWIARAEIASEDGLPIDSESAKVSFADFVVDWKKGKLDISGKTLGTYNSQLKLYLLPTFGERKLTSITTADLKKWVASLADSGVGATTIRQSYRLLHQILQAALEDELLGRNPAIGIKLPKIATKPKQGLTAKELYALADECGPYRSLVIFLGTCGLRVNEALALRVEDFDLEAKVVKVAHSWTTDEFGKKLRNEDGEFVPGTTKTGEERAVPLDQNTIELVKPLLEGKAAKDWVFTGVNGQALDYGFFRRKYFKPATDKLGLKNVVIHSLRHTTGSLLASLGAPIPEVSKILGHSSAKMTLDVYGHAYPAQTAAWMDKLGEHLADANEAMP